MKLLSNLWFDYMCRHLELSRYNIILVWFEIFILNIFLDISRFFFCVAVPLKTKLLKNKNQFYRYKLWPYMARRIYYVGYVYVPISVDIFNTFLSGFFPLIFFNWINMIVQELVLFPIIHSHYIFPISISIWSEPGKRCSTLKIFILLNVFSEFYNKIDIVTSTTQRFEFIYFL